MEKRIQTTTSKTLIPNLTNEKSFLPFRNDDALGLVRRFRHHMDLFEPRKDIWSMPQMQIQQFWTRFAEQANVRRCL